MLEMGAEQGVEEQNVRRASEAGRCDVDTDPGMLVDVVDPLERRVGDLADCALFLRQHQQVENSTRGDSLIHLR